MRNATSSEIPQLIADREEFTNSGGTLRGIKNPDVLTGAGILEDNERHKFLRSIHNIGITYLVLSYETPIAWETKDGHRYKTTQHFTTTTSKHMSLLSEFESTSTI